MFPEGPRRGAWDLVSYLSWGLPGAGLLGGLTAERSARGNVAECGPRSGSLPSLLGGGSGLSLRGCKRQAKAGGSGEYKSKHSVFGEHADLPSPGLRGL